MALRSLVLLCVSVLAGCAAASSGTQFYGEIRYVEESGDVVGTWVELTSSGPSTQVYLVDCEGACNGGGVFPATDISGALHFTAVRRWTSSSGEPGSTATRYVAVRRGRSLTLTSPDHPDIRINLPERRARDPRIDAPE